MSFLVILPIVLSFLCYYFSIHKILRKIMGFNLKVFSKRKAFFVNVKENIFGNFFSLLKWIFERVLEKFFTSDSFVIVRDPEIIKKIMLDDFDKFQNRMNMFDERLDKIYAQTLPVLRNERWRDTRERVSPFYCEKSIREMFKSITTCVDSFLGCLSELSEEQQKISSKHILARFTSSVIATCCLGLNVDSERHESSYKAASRLANCFGFIGKMKIILMNLTPKIYQLMQFNLMDTETRGFFEKTVVEEMRRRREQSIVKSDMIQFLNEHLSNFPEEMHIAQAVVFFGAGFETTTYLLQMACYELAKNENVQTELASEIDKVNLELSGERVSFETLEKMTLLNCVVMETLRLWPPSINIDRSCNSDCKLNGSDGKIYEFKANDQIIIPVHEIHRSEEFYENPNNFMPQRFEKFSKPTLGTYLPFGLGSRCCLGQKFSTLVVKLFIFHLLSSHRIEVFDKLSKECEFGQPLRFTKLKKSKLN